MTKTLLWVVIIAAVVFVGWQGFNYWEKVDAEKADTRKQAQSAEVRPEALPGMANQLETSLRMAQSQGPEAFKQWLRNYGSSLSDPRKAWIELDYCVAVARKDPQEARRVFASVKQRTPPNSPVAPRIRDLSKTFE
jgi:hypothetical protein